MERNLFDIFLFLRQNWHKSYVSSKSFAWRVNCLIPTPQKKERNGYTRVIGKNTIASPPVLIVKLTIGNRISIKNWQLWCVLDTIFKKCKFFEQKYYRKLVDFIFIFQKYPIIKTSFFEQKKNYTNLMAIYFFWKIGEWDIMV